MFDADCPIYDALRNQYLCLKVHCIATNIIDRHTLVAGYNRKGSHFRLFSRTDFMLSPTIYPKANIIITRRSMCFSPTTLFCPLLQSVYSTVLYRMTFGRSNLLKVADGPISRSIPSPIHIKTLLRTHIENGSYLKPSIKIFLAVRQTPSSVLIIWCISTKHQQTLCFSVVKCIFYDRILIKLEDSKYIPCLATGEDRLQSLLRTYLCKMPHRAINMNGFGEALQKSMILYVAPPPPNSQQS